MPLLVTKDCCRDRNEILFILNLINMFGLILTVCRCVTVVSWNNIKFSQRLATSQSLFESTAAKSGLCALKFTFLHASAASPLVIDKSVF